MGLAHAQPKFFYNEHALGRKLQTEKIAFEVRGHHFMYSKPPPKSRLLLNICLASCLLWLSIHNLSI